MAVSVVAAEQMFTLAATTGDGARRWAPVHALAVAAGIQFLDQVLAQGQPGEVGAAAAARLVADPVQVGAYGVGADEQPGRDLGVGVALGD
jgi:hypothetical protein